MTTFDIRLGTQADTRSILALAMGLYAEINHNLPDLDAKLATDMLLRQYDNFYPLLAFERDRRAPIGLLAAIESAAIYAGGRYGSIQEFYVEGAMRSKGVGRGLLDALLRIGATRKWRRLEVTATQSDVSGRTAAFYRANGFEPSGPRLKLEL